MEAVSDADELGVRITVGQASRLLAYRDLVRDKAIPLGLVSEADAPRIYRRHVLDSLSAAALFGTRDRLACDLGSGAGLPGAVLAIAVPRCRFLLIEPRRRAVAFLELVVERLALSNVEVASRRAAEVRVSADVVTARAFGSPSRTWSAAAPLLASGGRLIYFAGERAPALPPLTPKPVLAFHGSLIIMTKS